MCSGTSVSSFWVGRKGLMGRTYWSSGILPCRCDIAGGVHGLHSTWSRMHRFSRAPKTPRLARATGHCRHLFGLPNNTHSRALSPTSVVKRGMQDGDGNGVVTIHEMMSTAVHLNAAERTAVLHQFEQIDRNGDEVRSNVCTFHVKP